MLGRLASIIVEIPHPPSSAYFTVYIGFLSGAVGVHRQICLAGYVVRDFAGTFGEELYL